MGQHEFVLEALQSHRLLSPCFSASGLPDLWSTTDIAVAVDKARENPGKLFRKKPK